MRTFAIKRTLKLGVKSLCLHGLRSILTVLGIVFGVCSVIAMLAIGEGASQEALERIRQLGSHNILVESVKPPEDQSASASRSRVVEYGLTYDDAERISQTLPTVEIVVPTREIRQNIRSRERRIDGLVVGTMPWYMDVAKLRLKQGRFITWMDVKGKHNVCVLGAELVRALFPVDEPLGMIVRLGQQPYKVVGSWSPGPTRAARDGETSTRICTSPSRRRRRDSAK